MKNFGDTIDEEHLSSTDFAIIKKDLERSLKFMKKENYDVSRPLITKSSKRS